MLNIKIGKRPINEFEWSIKYLWSLQIIINIFYKIQKYILNIVIKHYHQVLFS